jgi:hypothetical protein
MTVQELLQALSWNETQAHELAQARKAILAELEKAVAPGETVAFAGYQCLWKPGRKSTDHESAAKAAHVPESIIEAHSTTKTTVAWAKVTKDAKVPKAVLEQFTTEGAPSFVVEPVK